MKTMRQWLQLLPEPFRTQALTNAEHYNGDPYWILIDELKYENQADALYSAFPFTNAPEGYDYWERVWIGVASPKLN